MEPLLESVNLRHLDVDRAGHPEWCQIDALSGRHTDMGRPCSDVPQVDWVIVGGESGPKARTMYGWWASYILEQCRATGVQFFFKQGSQAKSHGLLHKRP